jgi:hypothetical protein
MHPFTEPYPTKRTINKKAAPLNGAAMGEYPQKYSAFQRLINL